MKPLLLLIVSYLPIVAQLVISPNNVTITAPGQTVQFVISGGGANFWQLDCVVSGCGTITQSGKYTAPPIFPIPPPFATGTTVFISAFGTSTPARARVSLPPFSGNASPVPTPVVVFVDNITLIGAIDGVNTVFSLPSAPNPALSLQLFRNGILQRSGEDFVLNGSKVTFQTVPEVSDKLIASYRTL